GRSQDLDQQDHVHRVHGPVQAPAENGLDVVARPPVEGQLDARLVEVGRDVLDAGAGLPKGGDQVESLSQFPAGPRFRHAVRKIRHPGYPSEMSPEPGYLRLLESGELEERVE